MDIRKISIGSDYKSSAMHYLVGQSILGGSYTIHLIQYESSSDSIKIWIERQNEILLWKEFNSNMPISIEYNINF
jgi:ABC-type ATPase involved in cell division